MLVYVDKNAFDEYYYLHAQIQKKHAFQTAKVIIVDIAFKDINPSALIQSSPSSHHGRYFFEKLSCQSFFLRGIYSARSR